MQTPTHTTQKKKNRKSSGENRKWENGNGSHGLQIREAGLRPKGFWIGSVDKQGKNVYMGGMDE